jgi:hypothetical protein
MCVDQCIQLLLKVVSTMSILLMSHSRKTWICFLKTLEKVFSKFKELKALVENQTGRKRNKDAKVQ